MTDDMNRWWIRRLGWLLGTALVYAALDRVSVNFQVEPGVSVLFPATAAAIVGCMYGGIWGAVGVLLGSLVNPIFTTGWNPDVPYLAMINAMEGVIPWFAFRVASGLTPDLRNLKSLGLFVVTGAVLNTGLSAALGTSLVASPESASTIGQQMIVWWIADFSAAVLLAAPILAFAHSAFRAISPSSQRTDTAMITITSTLQITAAIVVLGWFASSFVQGVVARRIEDTRLAQQERAFEARNAVNSLHSNFLRAASIEATFRAEPDDELAQQFDETRDLHLGLFGEIENMVANSTPAAEDQLERLGEKTSRWFDQARREIKGTTPSQPVAGQERDVHLVSREFLNLTASIENSDALQWIRFRQTRDRLDAFDTSVNGLVLIILVVAFGTLTVRISRPLARLSTSIELLGSGSIPPRHHGDSDFMELRTLDHALTVAASELRDREVELQKQTHRAVEASRHKSSFLAKMSHELRTPLNAIIGFSDLLRQRALWEDKSRRESFVENIGYSARLLLTMIDDLLDIAKLDSGSISVRPHRCDIRAVVMNAAATVRPLLSERKQKLTLDLPDQPLMTMIDAEKVEHVLIRLLGNASKFSAHGDPIILRAALEDGVCSFEIEDHGVGIRQEDQERIFDTFEQVYQRGTLSQGAGLGLAVAKRFTEAQGGVIMVRSNKEQGATFTVRIPTDGSFGE